MRPEISDQIRRVWPALGKVETQQVVEQFRLTIKEMIDEHFRIDPAATPRSQGDDLCQAVESQPSRHQQGEPTHAVRAA